MAEFKDQENKANKRPVTIRKQECGSGQKWVPGYYKRDGTYVHGYCAGNINKKHWNQVERRRKTTVGLSPWPHIERSTEIIEKPAEEHTVANHDE
jgi:hypothetical protein